MHVITLISPLGGCGYTSRLSGLIILVVVFILDFIVHFYRFLSFHHLIVSFTSFKTLLNNNLIVCGCEIKQI